MKLFIVLSIIHHLSQRFANKVPSLNPYFNSYQNTSVAGKKYNFKNLIDQISNKILNFRKSIQAFFNTELFNKTSYKDLPQKL